MLKTRINSEFLWWSDEFHKFTKSRYLFAFLGFNIMQNWNLIFGIIIIASPILFAITAFPDSISWSWNEGRGGYLLCSYLCSCWINWPKNQSFQRNDCLSVIPMALWQLITYLASLEYGLREYIIESAETFWCPINLILGLGCGILLLWQYLLLLLWVYSLEKRWIRIAPAGPIFLNRNCNNPYHLMHFSLMTH